MKPRVHLLIVVGAAIVLLALLVTAAACGGSDETTTTSAAATETTEAVGATSAGGVEAKGLVTEPKTLSTADLEAMATATITAEHPKKGATEYTGVLFSELMTVLGVQSEAATVTLAAGDGYTAELPLADLDANAMLAFDDDGTYDAIMPGMEGKSWVSDVVSMEFK